MNEKLKKALPGLIVIGVVIYLFSTCGKESKTFDVNEYGQRAYIISQEFVKTGLKSPASADFPWECVKTFHIKDSIFMIKACVDSQNSFGANIRTNYECRLQYNGGDWSDSKNWTVLLLDLL